MSDYETGVEVGEELLGTCKSLLGALEGMGLCEGLENVASFCDGLDQTAMRCTVCDWWTEPGELDELQRCGDCAEYDVS